MIASDLTPVDFKTDIDCCKRLMSANSGLPIDRINPQIGDRIRVYHDSEFEVWLRVVERRWVLVNGCSPTLECLLGLDMPWSGMVGGLVEFTRMMTDRFN